MFNVIAAIGRHYLKILQGEIPLVFVFVIHVCLVLLLTITLSIFMFGVYRESHPPIETYVTLAQGTERILPDLWCVYIFIITMLICFSKKA